MVMTDFFMEALISKNLLSVQYGIQQDLKREISAEATMCTTVKQKNALKELFDGARAYLKSEGCIISVELEFLYVPKGMEDYASMLKSNALSRVKTVLKDRMMDIISLEDSQALIRDEIQTWAVEHLRSAIGGVS